MYIYMYIYIYVYDSIVCWYSSARASCIVQRGHLIYAVLNNTCMCMCIIALHVYVYHRMCMCMCIMCMCIMCMCIIACNNTPNTQMNLNKQKLDGP